ncbi:HD-GYP domain-containing protein [Streptomyces polyrhachis]|uniref:HD-GYP domain-containing protein n=1 Tax=Streptomyces polyrhachis TaxID=1282885 RepID=A0ABW2GLS8_9ACTN
MVRPRPPATVVAACAAAPLLAALGLCWTLWYGLRQPASAAAFAAVIALGELAASRARERLTAPLATAGALAYALLGESAGLRSFGAAAQAVPQIVAVVAIATLLGSVPRIARGHGPPLADQLARRVLVTAFAATCFQPLFTTGTLGRLTGGRGPGYALVLVAVLALAALCDAVLGAVLARARTGWPFVPLLRDELRALVGIGSAMVATGAVMALATAVAGLWALPVFSLPLLLTQLSFRRYETVRTTYRQTIASLARATEIAGYTRPGHARRVAGLSRGVGRELGLTEVELDLLEQAALMHDIGQLSLVDPVADGATQPLRAVQRRRIALLGAAVVRQTGVGTPVAQIVERQAEPYREQPLAARIVRAANDYDDLAVGSSSVQGPLQALERLRLDTAEEYDPRVVAALHGVLARGSVPYGGGWAPQGSTAAGGGGDGG